MNAIIMQNNNEKRKKELEEIKEGLKSDLSFVDNLSVEGFSRLSDRKIAYTAENEIFDDSEDDIWASYLKSDN